jgi:hypothetical protein
MSSSVCGILIQQISILVSEKCSTYQTLVNSLLTSQMYCQMVLIRENSAVTFYYAAISGN